MVHEFRLWSVASSESAEQLAHYLVEQEWYCCKGFKLASYLFLNDSSPKRGVQQYAVMKQISGASLQFDGIMPGWCDFDLVLRYIEEIVSGKFDNMGLFSFYQPNTEKPDTHGQCHFCA